MTHVKYTDPKSICCSYFQCVVVAVAHRVPGLENVVQKGERDRSVKTSSQGCYVGCLSGFMVGKESGPIESIEVAALGK